MHARPKDAHIYVYLSLRLELILLLRMRIEEQHKCISKIGILGAVEIFDDRPHLVLMDGYGNDIMQFDAFQPLADSVSRAIEFFHLPLHISVSTSADLIMPNWNVHQVMQAGIGCNL